MATAPKDLLNELRARGTNAKGTAFLGRIKGQAEAIHRTFAKGACNVCDGALVRMKSGLVECEAGHSADVPVAQAWANGQRSSDVTAADHGMELVAARVLQAKRGHR